MLYSIDRDADIQKAIEMSEKEAMQKRMNQRDQMLDTPLVY